MNTRVIAALVRRDLAIVVQNKGALIPMIIVPLIFMVLLPAGVGLGVPALAATPDAQLAQLESLVARLPGGLQAELAPLDMVQRVVVFAMLYLLAPMFLIIPLMLVSVIAADSFAGEKERKTLEALLYTPASDRELFIAKVLSALLPAWVVSIAGFVLYGVTANLSAWPVMGQVFFPNLMWIILIVLVVPAGAALGLGITVLVSARVSTFQEAYQIGGVCVLPLLLLIAGQATGVMYLSWLLVLALGIVLAAAGAVSLWYGSRAFSRNSVISRL